ncbi:MAG: hypothetical protein SCI25_04495 [Desulfuromonadales bacterium]|nr:hypothetical protein [Desulfuromonadales bacterium]MDW7757819.1 hypothetical protein [Desulfuromonadales bacterium]
MFRIVEKNLSVEFPWGHHLHCMVCQLPTWLSRKEHLCRLTEPTTSWEMVRSVLEMVAAGEGNLKKLHFLLFPESTVPAERVEEALDLIRNRFHNNTVTMFGVEHTTLADYREVLERYREDNAEALAQVLEDIDAGDVEQLPANWAVIAVKEADGKVRVFLEAKSHPYFAEENPDALHDLYRGKVFPLFHCHPNPFNFMALICFDYIYRTIYQSNISVLIDKANELFFQTRQRLDLLAVLECNPKPEHRAFRDVVNGYYGEYLSQHPGVRDSITVFCNTSDETTGSGSTPEATFGRSSVIIHENHKMKQKQFAEFETDDFGGLPVCRMRFGTGTRLYYFNLPVFHELDPRTTRVPLRVHSIFQPDDNQGWQRVFSE